MLNDLFDYAKISKNLNKSLSNIHIPHNCDNNTFIINLKKEIENEIEFEENKLIQKKLKVSNNQTIKKDLLKNKRKLFCSKSNILKNNNKINIDVNSIDSKSNSHLSIEVKDNSLNKIEDSKSLIINNKYKDKHSTYIKSKFKLVSNYKNSEKNKDNNSNLYISISNTKNLQNSPESFKYNNKKIKICPIDKPKIAEVLYDYFNNNSNKDAINSNNNNNKSNDILKKDSSGKKKHIIENEICNKNNIDDNFNNYTTNKLSLTSDIISLQTDIKLNKSYSNSNISNNLCLENKINNNVTKNNKHGLKSNFNTNILNKICSIIKEKQIINKIKSIDTNDNDNSINDFEYNEKQSDTIKTIPKEFLRRRICSHFYKILSKVAKRLLNEKEMKKLTLIFEQKAREIDPNMGDDYKKTIYNFFKKIRKIFEYNIE